MLVIILNELSLGNGGFSKEGFVNVGRPLVFKTITLLMAVKHIFAGFPAPSPIPVNESVWNPSVVIVKLAV